MAIGSIQAGVIGIHVEHSMSVVQPAAGTRVIEMENTQHVKMQKLNNSNLKGLIAKNRYGMDTFLGTIKLFKR